MPPRAFPCAPDAGRQEVDVERGDLGTTGARGTAAGLSASALMARAFSLAERGRATVSPNPLVGCVLARDGDIVGEGWHQRAGAPHAEIVALAEAGERARGAVAYVTLEPCDHTGRTAPCTQALIAAGVSRVVAALEDPHPLAGGGARTLRAAGVDVDFGLGRDTALRQNAVFLHGLREQRPYVILKAAVSLDGRIAAADGTSRWLTGDRARERAHRQRAEVDAVAVGSGTVLEDDPRLTVRLPDYSGRQPLRVVLDARGRTPISAAVLDRAAPTVVYTGSEAAARPLRAAGAEVQVVSPAPDGGVDLLEVLGRLWERGVRSVLVEGGAAVTGSFIGLGHFERLTVHVAPLFLGSAGLPLLRGGPATLGDAERFSLGDVETVGSDVILTLDRAPAGAPELAAHATRERRT